MSSYHSARVPLVLAGPGIGPGRVSEPCSLVDMLPTMLELGGAPGVPGPELGQPLDGRSLLALSRGEWRGNGEAIGEYCAELTGHPVFMIRRGPYKYIHCAGDPSQLYHLEDDPEERKNLASVPEYSAVSSGFATEVADRWDSEALRRDVMAKQKQRRAVHAAMQAGSPARWDYNPPRDASEEYVRNHMDWPVVASRSRVPWQA